MNRQSYPHDSNGQRNLAIEYLGIGQFKKAITEAHEAVRLDPEAGQHNRWR